MNTSLLKDLYLSFVRIGGLTFGGGYAMMPMLQKEVVERHHWATEEEVLDAYAIAQCAPGVIAVNTATYVGYKQGGVMGGLAAALGVVTPSFIVILLVASLLNNFIELTVVQHALAGVRACVCALVLKTVLSMLRRNVKDLLSVLIFAGAFLAAAFTTVSPILPIILAALLGVLLMGKKEASL